MSSAKSFAEELASVLSCFEENARHEIRSRWEAWPKDFATNDAHEVVGGLLARQGSLAVGLACNPTAWTGNVAPIYLRCMADVHITIAWILKDPVQRSRSYVLHGLGQVKLQIEHRKRLWEEEAPDDDNDERRMVETLETWLDSQRFSFLTEVNVGSWSQLSVRDMALEADLADFYNLVYVPFSSAVHSMWHHIEPYNLTRCSNALHGGHRVPTILSIEPDAGDALLAAKYLAKSLAAFDVACGVQVEAPDSYAELASGLEQVFRNLEPGTPDDEV